MTARIPPIQCLLTFEALARLRSVTLAAEELCVTPSAVSHRVKQLEQIIGTKLFGRADFSLTTDGSEYLAHVREGLSSLERFPGKDGAQAILEYCQSPPPDTVLLITSQDWSNKHGGKVHVRQNGVHHVPSPQGILARYQAVSRQTPVRLISESSSARVTGTS